MKLTKGIFTTALMAACGLAVAQTVDGIADPVYGSPIVVQNTQTQFGDSNLGLPDFANGSELDNCYVYRTATDLYILVGGNLESNFNKLEIFIDSIAGGHTRLTGDYPDVDFGALNRMSDDGTGNGLTFDTALAADYWLGLTCGNSPLELYANYSEVKAVANGGVGYYLGMGVQGNGTLNGGTNPFGIEATLDNSNTAGVPGGNGIDPGNGAGVTTGMEFRIPLAAIGNPTGPIKLCIFVNGGGHDYLSNQVLSGLNGGDNLAEPRLADFSAINGEQWFTVPAAAEKAVPDNFVIRLGRLDAGNVASLAQSDGNVLRVCKFIVPNQSVDPVNVEVGAPTTVSNPSSLEMHYRNRMQTTGSFRVALELRDFTAGAWVNRAEFPVNTSFSDRTVVAGGPYARFVSGGRLLMRYTVKQTGPAGASLWCHEVDSIDFTVGR
ncbi:MAG: hypothetical protein KIT11_04705 [Fimbriimonadaceae bacterium]|nr:hypothetical protein [Fimbriimonadaceae bacterium]QYK56807.1 MAG: hypothetical protein KF733_04820 [Fimbriimonadaceae bacterium]